jgi:hypothetical protein
MKSFISLFVTSAFLLLSPVKCEVPSIDFIEDQLFSSTIYYLMLEAFWEGMGWPTLYDNADTCREGVSDLFDDFYRLNVNHTTSDS